MSKLGKQSIVGLTQYSHRNGENMRPTEPGWYWYIDSYSAEIVEYVADSEGDKFWSVGCELPNGPMIFIGRFWGPLEPPWKE